MEYYRINLYCIFINTSLILIYVLNLSISFIPTCMVGKRQALHLFPFYSFILTKSYFSTTLLKLVKKKIWQNFFLILSLQLSLWASWTSGLCFCSVPLPVFLIYGKWPSRMLGWRNESLNKIFETLLIITSVKMWIYFILGSQFLHGVNYVSMLIRWCFVSPFCWLLIKNISKNTFFHDYMTLIIWFRIFPCF